jgi:hypothetical protein
MSVKRLVCGCSTVLAAILAVAPHAANAQNLDLAAGGGKIRLHLRLATAVVAALLAATSPTRAQTSWTGTISTDWFTTGDCTAGVSTGATPTNINTVCRGQDDQ